MIKYYTENVLWHGQVKSRGALQENHARWLATLADYRISLDNFALRFDAACSRAQAEYDLSAAYTTTDGKKRTFSLRKRFRLIRQGEEWKIECEEDAKHYRNASGPLTNACFVK